MRPDLPPWLATALQAGAGAADSADEAARAALLAAADAAGAGLVVVAEDGAVAWSSEVYRLHGRPRWRRVRSLDDVTRGLAAADAGRVTAAYLTLVGSGDVELLYTVASDTGLPLDVLLRAAVPGVAVVERASYAVEPASGAVGDEPAARDADPGPRAEAGSPADAEEMPEPDPAPATASMPAEAADMQPEADSHRLVEGDHAFRELFRASPTALAVLDDDGRFAAVNDAFCRLVGRTRDTLLDEHTVYHALIHHEDRAAVLLSRTRLDADDRPLSPGEHRLLRSDGSPVWVRTRTSVITLDGDIHLLLSVENITAMRQREDQLLHDALHDALTGLPNRRLVLDRLDRALSRGRRNGARTAVLFVDVDDLKDVNDTHPWKHRAGDVLLTSVASSIRAALRDTDTLGRLGGDEFLAVCEDVGSDAAVDELAQRLLDAARTPVRLGSVTHVPAVSIGLAVADDDETASALLDRADHAMYVAKSQGGARVQRAGSVDSQLPGPDLLGALERGELRMHYQPVVSLATGSVLGLSAVLRWQHPTLGLLPTHEVRAALDSAAMLPVVDWCLDRAVNDVRTVAPTRVDHVSVWLPVPGRALQMPSTVAALRAAVAGNDGAQTPDSAPSLVLDVHEADLAVFTRRPRVRRLVDELSALGPVALGVEHLSADVLPVGTLQLLGAASASIDPELVQSAAENAACENLVRSLVEGATALGVVTVATGIGSTELLEEARRLGVHAVTGDLVGPVASLEIYSDLLHGDRIALPGAHDDELPQTVTTVTPLPQRPVLVAVPDQPADEADPADDARSSSDGGDVEPMVIDARTEPEPVAAQAEPHLDLAVQPAADTTASVPAPATRLLLGDVVDLAELVARELGVALPPPGEQTVAVEDDAEADALTDTDRPAPSTASAASAAPGRLPGLQDLHTALAEPEVSRALGDGTDRAAAAEGEAARGAGAPEDAAADGLDAVAGTEDMADESDDDDVENPQGIADEAPADQEVADEDGVDDEGPRADDTEQGALSRLKEDVVALLRWVSAPVADDREPGSPPAPATSEPGRSAPERDEDAAAPSRPDIDLRSSGRPAGSDGPTIMLRPSTPDALGGSTLRLDGRGGSDGGSVL